MTLEQLEKEVATETGLTIKDSKAAITAISKALLKDLKKGNSTRIPSLGTFSVKQHKARTGKNPRTQEPIQIPAKKVIAFKAAKVVREAINKK
jgi:DNA-binding protein HU-beta